MYNNPDKGFSLTELLIAIVLFGIISTGIVITMRSSMETTLLSRNLDELSINVNHAINSMRRDLEVAGRYVTHGMRIPNNPADNRLVVQGFDLTGCINNVPDDIDVLNMAGDTIGFIPEGTDTIAITTMAPPIQLNLRGCDPAGGPIQGQILAAEYPGIIPFIHVTNVSDFDCYINNVTASPIFAVIFGQDMSTTGEAILSELFTIDSVNTGDNSIRIANDGFSNARLSRPYPDDSRVYLLGPNPNVGKIEYFILESNLPNPQDPDTPLRQLVKRINNREIFPIADNITNLQIGYTMFNGLYTEDLSSEILQNHHYPVIIEVFITARSNDMVRGAPDSPPVIDPITQTNTARYIEDTFHSMITIRGSTYKATSHYYFP